MAILKELQKPSITRHYAPHETGAPIIEAKRLTVSYEAVRALDEVSFRLQPGDRVAVVGPNGAGKSTLFKVIAGVLAPTSGELNISGHGPGGHICIAYVQQRSQVDWNFPVTVAEVVMMGRIGKLGLFRLPKAQDWERVRAALDTVGMGNLARRQIGELSGGQQQRMFIARALAQEAEIVLMDEPLTGLDLNSQESIFRILDELQKRRVTVLVAIHDLNLAAERFEHTLLLNRRLVAFGPAQEVLTQARLMEAYGGHLRLISGGGELLAVGDTCCDEGHTH
jgi:ABC-type Mn2+/Zn2+ transport system ATPase subunit